MERLGPFCTTDDGVMASRKAICTRVTAEEMDVLRDEAARHASGKGLESLGNGLDQEELAQIHTALDANDASGVRPYLSYSLGEEEGRVVECFEGPHGNRASLMHVGEDAVTLVYEAPVENHS